MLNLVDKPNRAAFMKNAAADSNRAQIKAAIIKVDEALGHISSKLQAINTKKLHYSKLCRAGLYKQLPEYRTVYISDNEAVRLYERLADNKSREYKAAIFKPSKTEVKARRLPKDLISMI
jgi:hypothetical protein